MRRLLAAALLLASSVALAAPAPQRVRNYEFDADVLKGEIPRPLVELGVGRTLIELGSLIHVRLDFIREILKSAEDL